MNLYSAQLGQLSRREFLKLTAAGLLGWLFAPASLALAVPTSGLNLPCQGRVLEDGLKVYVEPDLRAKAMTQLPKDTVIEIKRVVYGEDTTLENRVWYAQAQGYVHSVAVQPVETQLNPVERYIIKKGLPLVVTVPFTDTIWDHRQPHKAAYRLYYGAVSWVTAVALDSQNQPWYYLSDEWTSSVVYYGKPEHFHIYTAEELAPLSPEVPVKDKRIEVRLKDQLMIAYEAERPVFMSRVSTGTAYGTQTFYTPPGQYFTNGKFPSRHMTHPDKLDPNAYDLPGVPWACYITSNGIAFHGTYWHNDFGRKRSHGCINLNLDAARWVYRWTSPAAPLQERVWLSNAATRVDVIA